MKFRPKQRVIFVKKLESEDLGSNNYLFSEVVFAKKINENSALVFFGLKENIVDLKTLYTKTDFKNLKFKQNDSVS